MVQVFGEDGLVRGTEGGLREHDLTRCRCLWGLQSDAVLRLNGPFGLVGRLQEDTTYVGVCIIVYTKVEGHVQIESRVTVAQRSLLSQCAGPTPQGCAASCNISLHS